MNVVKDNDEEIREQTNNILIADILASRCDQSHVFPTMIRGEHDITGDGGQPSHPTSR